MREASKPTKTPWRFRLNLVTLAALLIIATHYRFHFDQQEQRAEAAERRIEELEKIQGEVQDAAEYQRRRAEAAERERDEAHVLRDATVAQYREEAATNFYNMEAERQDREYWQANAEQAERDLDIAREALERELRYTHGEETKRRITDALRSLS